MSAHKYAEKEKKGGSLCKKKVKVVVCVMFLQKNAPWCAKQ